MSRRRPAGCLLPLLLPGLLGACSAAPDERESRPYVTEPFEPRAPRDDLSTGELIFECERHLRAWQQAMAAQRTPENSESIAFIERAASALVHREKARLEEQAVAGPPRNRAVASAALGFSQDPKTLPSILNNVADPDAAVRANALLGVGILAAPDTPLDPIYQAVLDPQAEEAVLRNAAFAGLRLAQKSRSDPEGTLGAILAPLLSNPLPTVRAQAASGLGLIGAAHLLPRLSTLARDDEDAMVRTAAVFALGEIGSPGSTAVLVAALRDRDRLVTGAARGALVKIHGKDFGPDPRDWQILLQD